MTSAVLPILARRVSYLDGRHGQPIQTNVARHRFQTNVTVGVTAAMMLADPLSSILFDEACFRYYLDLSGDLETVLQQWSLADTGEALSSK